jgi:hypothetical protein
MPIALNEAATNGPLKNSIVEFFNLAKRRAKFVAARKITICVAIFGIASL